MLPRYKPTLALHLKRLGSHQLPKGAPLKGRTEYCTVRAQPLVATVYYKSTEEKYRDPDSLHSRHFGLRSLLMRPTATNDSILNPIRLLRSKPRGFKYKKRTYGMPHS